MNKRVQDVLSIPKKMQNLPIYGANFALLNEEDTKAAIVW